MKLTGYAKIFLTASAILIASILIVLGSDITLKEMWSNYFSQPDPWVGIFTSIGAIFTVCVFIATVYATRKAGESARIAGEALELSRESSRKDDFIKQFTLLIDQHEKSHEVMMKHLDNYKINELSEIRWSMTIKEASEVLYSNYKFSAYMRMLFRVLKHCDENFYMQGDCDNVIREKKKYTSIVRSMIRNDVLYFVALNAMNERKSFEQYKKILKKFDFLEHLIFDNIGESIVFSFKEYNTKKRKAPLYNFFYIEAVISMLINREIYKLINDDIIYSGFHVKPLFEEVINRGVYIIPYSFNYALYKNYNKLKYNELKEFLKSISGLNKIYNSSFSKLEKQVSEYKQSDILSKKYYFYFSHGESVYSKKNNECYNIEYFCDLIINNKITEGSIYDFIANEIKVGSVGFIDYEVDENDTINRNCIIKEEEIYRICKEHIQFISEKKLVANKEILRNDIFNVVVSEMNKTALIENGDEKFILDKDNNIDFKEKNS